jgi:enoyl-CoA hydratase/carnithine racemase
MAMESDLIVAAENTQFQITEVGRGLGAPQHWAKAWFWGGGKFATQVALTSQFFSAEEAYRLGMVNRVVPADQHIAEAERLAEQIMANPPLSVRCNVRVSRYQVRRMCEEAEMYGRALKLHLTEDFRESARAFVEKRKAVYKGR